MCSADNIMNAWVLPLVSVRTDDAGDVGRKAAVLGTLLEAGFPVLPGLCLTAAAFRQALRSHAHSIRAILRQHDLSQPSDAAEAARRINEILAQLVVPDWLVGEIEGALDRYVGDAALLAVRSSSTAEDREMASFAGQYDTLLGVTRSQLVSAIVAIWRSFYSAYALQARSKHKALAESEAMAVLIQPMIEPECSGICYSVDPVATKGERIIINACWGLGPGVTDGSVATDTIWIRRSGIRLEKQLISEKEEQMVLSPKGGIERAGVPAQQVKAACLPGEWWRRIAQFGLAVEPLLGKPQEVEWAILNKQVWLLQSRPITGLPAELTTVSPFPVYWQNEQDRRNLWTLTEYSQGRQPPLPLEHDDVAVVESIREEACKWMGVDRNGIIRVWNGRAYFRSIPLPLSEADRNVRHNAYLDLQIRLQRQGLTAWDYWGPEIIRAVERLRSFDLENADGPAIADHLEQALAVRRRHAMLHPMLWFRPPQTFKDALAAVSGLDGQELLTTAYQLLEGEETPLTELVDGLYELAVTARQTPELAQLVANPPPFISDELNGTAAGRSLLGLLERFLDKFGDRTGNGYGSEATIKTPTWREQPALVLELAAAYLGPQSESPAALRTRARQERQARLQAFYQACPDETMVATFQGQLEYARKSFATLELHNHYIDQMALGQLRQAAIAAARWLCGQGLLPAVEDVYWLYFDEILEALRGELMPEETGLISRRKELYETWAALDPPVLLGTPVAELPPRPEWTDEATCPTTGAADQLHGLGASAGRVEGRARVVQKNEALPELRPGDILVTENAGPLLTPWFPILGGLVLDTGSLGQHAAATAREYGLPAVIGTKIATLVIPDEAWLSIDGRRGIVKIAPA